MKRFTNEQIKPENYSRIQMLPGGIYRVMIKTTEEVDENGMIMVATAKYTHRPTEEEISEDYQWHTETLEKMKLEQAKLIKTREITEYNSSSNVDGFYLNGEKHWLTLDRGKRRNYLPRHISRSGMRPQSSVWEECFIPFLASL